MNPVDGVLKTMNGVVLITVVKLLIIILLMYLNVKKKKNCNYNYCSIFFSKNQIIIYIYI